MTRRILRLITSALFSVSIFGGASAQDGKRVALVVGNGEYAHASRLENPKNDASDMTAALEALGFKVHRGIDLDKAAMDKIVRDFAEALVGSKIALFFYAGHGLQVGGQNYLVPVDAKLTTASAIDFEMVRLDLIQRAMEREVKTNIIFLDACRDNPLARNLARALGSRSTQVGRGLANVEAGEGTLISFSTQPGNVALDGTGRNSPFAGSLVKRIATPGEDLSSILIQVRNDVIGATERRQVPWEHSSLTSKVFFLGSKNQERDVSTSDQKGTNVTRLVIERTAGPACQQQKVPNLVLTVQGTRLDGNINDAPINGELEPTGRLSFSHASVSALGKVTSIIVSYKGQLNGNSGAGTYSAGSCRGTFVATRIQ